MKRWSILSFRVAHSEFNSFSVVVDNTGTSKGYGFVRFGNEQEQQTALATMVNAMGLGAKPIKVKPQPQMSRIP